MKILMLTPYLPFPPASGGQIRTLNLLKYLRTKNEITLISLYKNDGEKKYLPYLKPYCKEVYLCKRPERPWTFKNIYRSVFSSKPFLIVRNYSEEATELVTKLVKEGHFDVIHAETFYIMPHILDTNIPIVLVEQTIEYKVYQHFVNSLPFFVRPLFMLDIIKLKQWERFYWRKAYVVGAVSESDKKEIVHLEPFVKPMIVPNGAGEEMVAQSLPKKDLRNASLLFMGNFSWLQNTEAAQYLIEKVFPKLKKIMPEIHVNIAGQNVTSKINIGKENGVRLINIPPNDSDFVRQTYQDATLFVAPIFGPGGTRLKILAAMASGLPIVTTKTGIEGLAVKDGEHILIANTPDEFIRQIKRILSSKVLYNKIRKNAYELVKEKYNWEKIATELEIAYEGIKKR